MSITNIQDILALVEKPSRYLGSEINTIKKDLSTVKLRFALVFPDLYEIGTSHFGLQILYHILNSHPDIAAERVFAPGVDMESHLRRSNLPLFSLESHEPLNHFDIIGFSLLYELNYTNILTILELVDIPFRADRRDGSHPMIIAGGPSTCNPEPIAEFFDAIVVGDGEQVVLELCQNWIQWKENTQRNTADLLKQWSNIEGVYIPSFFEPQIDRHGFQALKPRFSDYSVVKRAIVANLDQTPFPDKPIVPYGKPVHDRLRIEVSRGCTRGCRFCLAGMIYRPVRERSPERLMFLADNSIAATGYEDMSLLSLSTGDYGCIVPLMERLMARLASDHVAVSLPSLRAGTLTPQLMKLIKRVRKTGFTIAPEAGSQRLRDVINKNIRESEIVETVKDAFNLGWQVIKLYFMIGLPTETHEDLRALVDLVKKLRKVKVPNRRKTRINVSVATFIPKPHTPFQWASQISLTESKERINWLKNQLKLPGIQFKWQNPEVSLLEGVWARGDRRLRNLLISAYKKGCKFDGWSDKFKFHLWQEAIAETGVNLDFYTLRKRDICEPLPWDHIDTQISKEFLQDEWHESMQAALTEDCRDGDCHQCGVCDFELIEPRTYQDCDSKYLDYPAEPEDPNASYKKLTVSYSKLGEAKYYGHLEMVNIFLRALKRAGIPVKFTEGFHPKPKVSFDDPLPIGMESQNETMKLTVPVHVNPQTVVESLNANLPAGLRVRRSESAPSQSGTKSPKSSTYHVILKKGKFDRDQLKSFICRIDFTIEIKDRKGKLKKLDLKDMVLDIVLIDSRHLQMVLRSEPGKTLRPPEVLHHIFGLSEYQIKQARVLKQRAKRIAHGI
jgi:radical SAM family uncharacterized protein/radical SAM-linked protein